MERSYEKSKSIKTNKELQQRMEKEYEVLQEAYEYLKKLDGGARLAIECFNEGNQGKGYNLLAQIAEGLAWLVDAFTLTQGAQKEKINRDELNEVISELIEAMENRDENLIVELLEFELISRIELWQETLKRTILN